LSFIEHGRQIETAADENVFIYSAFKNILTAKQFGESNRTNPSSVGQNPVFKIYIYKNILEQNAGTVSNILK
jgi:hypothetical protein